MKRLIAAAAIMLLATTAHAGDNSCFGLLVVGPQWTAIHTGANNSPPNSNVCRFKTASPLGQRVLRVCPNGSECLIEMPLPANGLVPAAPSIQTITRVTHVEASK